MFTLFFFSRPGLTLTFTNPVTEIWNISVYVCMYLKSVDFCLSLSKNPFSSLGFPLFLHVRDLLSLLRKRSNTAVRVFKKKKNPLRGPDTDHARRSLLGRSYGLRYFWLKLWLWFEHVCISALMSSILDVNVYLLLLPDPARRWKRCHVDMRMETTWVCFSFWFTWHYHHSSVPRLWRVSGSELQRGCRWRQDAAAATGTLSLSNTHTCTHTCTHLYMYTHTHACFCW